MSFRSTGCTLEIFLTFIIPVGFSVDSHLCSGVVMRFLTPVKSSTWSPFSLGVLSVGACWVEHFPHEFSEASWLTVSWLTHNSPWDLPQVSCWLSSLWVHSCCWVLLVLPFPRVLSNLLIPVKFSFWMHVHLGDKGSGCFPSLVALLASVFL